MVHVATNRILRYMWRLMADKAILNKMITLLFTGHSDAVYRQLAILCVKYSITSEKKIFIHYVFRK
jgi:hypothetical protein